MLSGGDKGCEVTLITQILLLKSLAVEAWFSAVGPGAGLSEEFLGGPSFSVGFPT